MQDITLRPNIIKALLIRLIEILFIYGLIIFCFYYLNFLAGFSPFQDLLDSFNITAQTVNLTLISAAIALAALTLLYTFFKINNIKIILTENGLQHFSGILTVSRKEFPYVKAARTYFHKYFKVLKTGELIIELRGTDILNLRLPYISRVQDKANEIESLISKTITKQLTENIQKAEPKIQQQTVQNIVQTATKKDFTKESFIDDVLMISKKQKLSKNVYKVILSHLILTQRIMKNDIIGFLLRLQKAQLISEKEISEVLFDIENEVYH